MKRWMLIAIAVLALVGCCPGKAHAWSWDDSNTEEQKAQEKISKQILKEIGMPSIIALARARAFKAIIEEMDKNRPTHCYVWSAYQAKLYKIPAMAVGFPYSDATQYTAPGYWKEGTHGAAVLPQRDPDGLYKPSSHAGWFIMLVNPATSKAEPVYMGEKPICSPFELGPLQEVVAHPAAK